MTISNLNENENALISLFDVSGKFFYKKEIFADNVLIDLSEKLAGTYFMSIRIQEKETIWTIIKQ